MWSRRGALARVSCTLDGNGSRGKNPGERHPLELRGRDGPLPRGVSDIHVLCLHHDSEDS